MFEGRNSKSNPHFVAEGRPVAEGERGESGRVDPLPGRGHPQGDHQQRAGCPGGDGRPRDQLRCVQRHPLVDVLAEAAQEPSVPQDCDSTPEGKLLGSK